MTVLNLIKTGGGVNENRIDSMVERHMVALKSIIEEVGHLTYKFNDTELKLYGYRKKQKEDYSWNNY